PCLRLSGVEAERTLSGEGQEPPCREPQLVRLRRVAGGFGELGGLQVVVRENFGEVLDTLARLPLDPRRGRAMAARPLGTRDLAVGDVANEQVPERVLGVAFHRARPRRANEFLEGELVQSLFDLRQVATADLCCGARPEDLAEHR